jgi:uncharacterized membrane protein (DUF106 family)
MTNIFVTGYQAMVNLPYFWMILIIAFLVTLLTTVIYKYTTDQKTLREIKKDMKDLKDKLKKHSNDQKKMMSIQKEMLDKNMIMMKQSFKSMLYTFIPLILIFAWMNATIAYEPILPNSNVTITATISNSYPGDMTKINISSIPLTKITRNAGYDPGNDKIKAAQWIMETGKEGTYTVLIESETFKQSKELLVTSGRKYVNPISQYKESQLKSLLIGNGKVKPLQGIPVIGGLNWLWTYIILSVFMSIGLRKLMNVA